MNESDVLKILEGVGAAIVNSHIVYTSGKHGSAYVNKDALYPHTAKTSLLCRALAKQFVDDKVEVVIAPAVGGVILSQWTAYHLNGSGVAEVLGVYADKEEEDVSPPAFTLLPPKTETRFVVKRGYDKLVRDKNALVVEDLLTTGGSVRKVVSAVRSIGGKVVGVGVLCNRGGVTPDDLGGVPKLVALTNIKMDAWDAKDCPLCQQDVPINTDVGHGRQFLAKKK